MNKKRLLLVLAGAASGAFAAAYALHGYTSRPLTLKVVRVESQEDGSLLVEGKEDEKILLMTRDNSQPVKGDVLVYHRRPRSLGEIMRSRRHGEPLRAVECRRLSEG